MTVFAEILHLVDFSRSGFCKTAFRTLPLANAGKLLKLACRFSCIGFSQTLIRQNFAVLFLKRSPICRTFESGLTPLKVVIFTEYHPVYEFIRLICNSFFTQP